MKDENKSVKLLFEWVNGGIRTGWSTSWVMEASAVRVLLQLREDLFLAAANIVIWRGGNEAAFCSVVVVVVVAVIVVGTLLLIDREMVAAAAAASTTSGKLTSELVSDPGECCRAGLKSRRPLRAPGAATAPSTRPTFRHSESAQLLLRLASSDEEAESTFVIESC